MSNRTDFGNLADELIEMYRLDPNAPSTEPPRSQTLRWRLERELHNAFVAGQEASTLLDAVEQWRMAICAVTTPEGACAPAGRQLAGSGHQPSCPVRIATYALLAARDTLIGGAR